jgi:hypothetical protein
LTACFGAELFSASRASINETDQPRDCFTGTLVRDLTQSCRPLIGQGHLHLLIWRQQAQLHVTIGSTIVTRGYQLRYMHCILRAEIPIGFCPRGPHGLVKSEARVGGLFDQSRIIHDPSRSLTLCALRQRILMLHCCSCRCAPMCNISLGKYHGP